VASVAARISTLADGVLLLPALGARISLAHALALVVPWIAERAFAWIGRYRRMSKGYEHRVQTSETLIDLIAIRLMLGRLTAS
jgi:hypothetical protein